MGSVCCRRPRPEIQKVHIPSFPMAAVVTDNVGLTIGSHQQKWSRPESVTGINLEEKLSVNSLYNKVKGLLSGQAPLLERGFQAVSQNGPSGANSLRIMQWNILADALSIGKDNFVRCPLAALEWQVRRMYILQEILRVDPDVLTLQEVDHFGFFKHVLATCGYKGVFFPKPDSPTLYVDGNNGPDGCAMFYRTEKLKLLKEDSIVLKTLPGNNETNQVAIIMDFKIRETGCQVAVVTTHLKAKNGWEQLRYLQGSYLAKYLEDRHGGKALVVCGDFNAEYDEKVYTVFMKSGLGLNSAYREAGGTNTEPAYTTWKIRGGADGKQEKESKRSIDYMWYVRDKVALRTVLELPSAEKIGENRLPSHSYPSDHLSLAADFDIK